VYKRQAYNAEFKKLGKKQVTQKQVLAANPGLNPNNIRVGQKIFIPVLD
jgi:LysM repeat protein